MGPAAQEWTGHQRGRCRDHSRSQTQQRCADELYRGGRRCDRRRHDGMSLRAKQHACVIFAALALPAVAQDIGARPATPTESVTVTGIKDVEAAVSKFVGTMTVPTR